jgi:formate dehydrogenase subunit gamma
MTRPADAPAAGPELVRFGRPARWVHGLLGVLILSCIVTAAVLYNSSLQILIGHRRVVELVHVWCGYALPVPLLAGLASRGYRAELRRLDRFTPADWRWLRSRARRDGHIPVGKYNAGQKLVFWIFGASLVLLFVTGFVFWQPWFADYFPIPLRRVAVVVHAASAVVLILSVIAHVYAAIWVKGSLQAMTRGTVSWHWARKHHSLWYREMRGETRAARRDLPGERGGAIIRE